MSAGGIVVPVRNFVIQSKPIERYHQSLDTDLMKTNANTKKKQPPPLPLNKKTSMVNSLPSSPVLQKKQSTASSLSSSPVLQKKPSVPPPTVDVTPALKPCSKSIYCELQYMDDDEGKKHIATFSHPCRFSEVCRRHEPHLVHIPHVVPMCSDDKKCTKLGDPVHRAKYRHTNLPDYLIPCRFRDKCKAKSNADHRAKYFHGEKVSLPS